MTHVYSWISLRGANQTFLLLALLFPAFAYAGSAGDDGGNGNCCDHFDYWIKFPKDAVGNCEFPDAADLAMHEGSCDLLAISKKDQKFTVPGSSNCYKILRTYGVINWCEYVDGADPVVVGRDEDCDGQPGDEDVYVIVKTRYGNDPCEYDKYGYYSHSYSYQHVWYDRDADPYNTVPAAKTKDYHCDYESNPKGFWKEVKDITKDYKYYSDHCEIASVGYWQYTQVIKVTDHDAPTVSYTAPEPFCSYSSNADEGCPGSVTLDFSVAEDCSPQDVTVTAFLDAGRTGTVDAEVTDLLSGTYPDYSLTGTFPLGSHWIKVLADDGCGNVGTGKIPFEVIDCKGPSPICINGLAIKLMPLIPAVDADADGDTDEGAMAVWATDFIASAAYDCNGPVKYSVNRVGEPVDEDNTGITLTCDDEVLTLVEVHAWDSKGNNDYCVTYVQVQSESGLCPPNIPDIAGPDGEEGQEVLQDAGMLAGRIATEYEMPVSGVMIHRMSADTAHQVSNLLGEFLFHEETLQNAYLVEPEANDNWLEGITISDLFLLKKYLMGLAELNSPYKKLAADLDASGSITQEDLDLLWSLFLYQATELEFTSSWQFIPKDYVFPDETNPWAEEIPSHILVEAIDPILTDLNFVAVKMGDFDESISPGARSTLGQLALQLPDLRLEAGEQQRIDIRSGDLARMAGYQLSLSFDTEQLELVEMERGAAGTQRFNTTDLDDGFIHTAWHRSPDNEAAGPSDDILFSLILRARENVRLSEALRITPRGLPAEAVGPAAERYQLALEFKTPTVVPTEFAVAQNSPNPFRQQTQIRYFLPEAATVELRITDVNGQLLRRIRTEGAAGENRLEIAREDLASGILFYSLTDGKNSITRKMLLVK